MEALLLFAGAEEEERNRANTGRWLVLLVPAGVGGELDGGRERAAQRRARRRGLREAAALGVVVDEIGRASCRERVSTIV